MANISEYAIRVEWSSEDECFIAKCLELPSLLSHGDTRNEAIEELECVLEEAVAIFEEDGDLIPEPISTKSYKGNISLRLSSETHKELVMAATESELSLNQYITTLIETNLYSAPVRNTVAELTTIVSGLKTELAVAQLLRHEFQDRQVMSGVDTSSMFESVWPESSDPVISYFSSDYKEEKFLKAN